ncbi:MAG: energy transducer TonB [Methylococcales bacterium]|nr:energy transducer TonB [Methylococcales bacterium]
MATTTSPKTHFLQPSVSVNDSLLMTLFFAAILHVILLLSISFSFTSPNLVSKQIEITLASFESEKPPIKASFLAQSDQIGGGNKEKKKKPKPRQQKMVSQGNNQTKIPKQKPIPEESTPKVIKKVITQENATKKIVTSETSDDKRTTSMEKPKLSAESLSQQISQLGETIRYEEPRSEKSKIKFINAVSAHKYVAAQYMKDWETKVERMGNLNYPEIARQKGFSATLITDVGIRPDGSIYSIRITKSSGNTELDNAAKRIIRLSSPFAALPKELLSELDILVIPRVWHFSDESDTITGL